MNITKKISPNKNIGRGGTIPDIIVDHITEGTYASAVDWLCNPAAEASANFVVARDGRITQLVEISDTAWGNGTSVDPKSGVYYLNSKSALVRQRATNANKYTVSIEHEGIYAQTHGALTDAQLAATIELHKFIRSEIKRIYGADMPVNTDHIIGHCIVAPVTKPNCPGELYPFNKVIAGMLGASSVSVAPAPVDNMALYIQKTLNRLKIPDVKTFQDIVNINIDGVPGAITQNALNDILLKPVCSIDHNIKNAVRYIQWRLGIPHDGIFGPQTLLYIKNYQKSVGITPDGIFGSQSWGKLIS